MENTFLMVFNSVDEADWNNALRFIWMDDISTDPTDLREYRFELWLGSSYIRRFSTQCYDLNTPSPGKVPWDEKEFDTADSPIHIILLCWRRTSYLVGVPKMKFLSSMQCQRNSSAREGSTSESFWPTQNVSRRKYPQESKPWWFVAAGWSTLLRNYSWYLITAQEGRYKVLGVPWNPESDQLILDIIYLAINLNPTKLVSLIGMFHNPLRFLSPI